MARFLAASVLILFAVTEALSAPPSAATSAKSMVVTVHPLATDAGIAVLKSRGNAIDAAVAAALTLGVVDGHNSGIGGGCFILIRTYDGRLIAIDGREMAPAKARPNLYVRDGKIDPDASQTGSLAVAVPGALLAYEYARKEYGRKPLKELLLPAAQIAETGFAIDRIYARNLRQSRAAITQFPATTEVLLRADGTPYLEGETLRQADLASTSRAIAEQGTDWFYRGPFSARCAAWMKANGGIIDTPDFANYQCVIREPLRTRYRDYLIIGFPPPSSGGVHVAQILHTLEPFDLKSIYRHDRSQFVHLVTEAMKLAFADRAHWLGDPAFADVPTGLASPEYGRSLAAQIDQERASKILTHGTPPNADRDHFSKHTTHLTAVDDDGNWVAITATVNTSFGSKVIVPGTGVILNNEMDDFSIEPGVPNAFGLVGAEANAIAPGKRPLSSMSPTMVLKDDQPILTLGAAGGPTIISQVVSVLIQRLDLELPLSEAVAAPRFHHQWLPDELVVEEAMPEALLAQLRERGHRIRKRDSIAVLQAIERNVAERLLLGVHDPRVPGKAAGDSPPPVDPAQRAQAAARLLAGEWPMDRVIMKDGRAVKGLKLAERPDEVEFAEILRQPGKRIAAVVRPLPSAEIAQQELLPAVQRQELQERFQWIRSRARIESGRMDRIVLTLEEPEGQQRWVYRGPWFELASTAGDESTRQVVVRMEQVFRAFLQLVVPRRDSDRILRLQLFGTRDEYASRLQEMGIDFSGPAFYSIPLHAIVAGSDIAAFGDRWAESQADLADRKQHYEQLKREFGGRLGQVALDLRKSGISENKIREELRLRRNLWSDEYGSAMAKIRQTQVRNAARFDELTLQMFRRLYHEAFHAYVEEFVFPDARFRFPRWLNEGLAQIFESGQLENGTLRLDAPDPIRLKQLQRRLSQSPLAIQEFVTANDRPFTTAHADFETEQYYLYAWGVAYYLTFQYNVLAGSQLDDYVAPWSDTDDPLVRFERLVGMPCQEFDAEWRRHMLNLRPAAR